MKTIKILFAEDHEMVRNGIKLMLSNQTNFKAEIEEAVDGADVIHKATKNNYDVIILDINLPKHDGIYITKLLKSKNNHVKILALTMHMEDFVIRQMIEAGVLGYISKTSSIEELSKAILTVNNFDKYYSNDVAQILLNKTKKLSNKSYQDLNDQNIITNTTITQRELEVLKYIALEYTNKEIGDKLNISERTVGNHRNKLIQKLLVKNSIGLATYAVKNGLI
jgi:DNA-binding NarL/FixJ family response regulator